MLTITNIRGITWFVKRPCDNLSEYPGGGEDIERERGGGRGEQSELFEDIVQLAYVSRPRIVHQLFQ